MSARADEVVRVRLRYPDLDTFVEKFAPNVTRGGIFLASRDPRPVGAHLQFEVQLRDGTRVIAGEGRVTWVKEFIPNEPHKPYGMGVQFTRVDADSRPVLERLLQKRDVSGARPLPPRPPPATLRPQPSPLPRDAAAGATGTRPTLEGLDTLDETALRRAADRARVLSGRTDDLDALLAPEPEEKVTLSQALDDLPRILANRRQTGLYRVLGDDAPAPEGAPPPERKD